MENKDSNHSFAVASRRQNQMLERKCRFCPVRFKPVRFRDRHQKFCCDNCRKDFFRYGGPLPPQRFMERAWVYLEPKITQLVERLIEESGNA
jgi:hypothetical protein